MLRSVRQTMDSTGEGVPFYQADKRRRKKKALRCVKVVGIGLGCFVSVLVAALAIGLIAWLAGRGSNLPSDPYERALALLSEYPLIDGHNDLAMALRMYFENQLGRVNLSANSTGLYGSYWETDIPRLRAGKVGGQFWSAYMDCDTQFKDATRTFIDQIDVIKRFVQWYPDDFKLATSSQDIVDAARTGHIASMIGVEGGHAIDSSLGTLRQFYDLGARYLTLTHFCNTPWAHSSNDNSSNGLNDFGKRVVKEMNRLGMLVDISHVNVATMKDVLNTTSAPVIFSHSSAYAICNNARNVPDDVLEMMPSNGGIVMVNFYPRFVNCSENASYTEVADHIDHIKEKAGVDHIGIGSDFDGIDVVPVGLEDVSKYPNLFAELIRRNYSDSDVEKISRLNLIRVFQEAEKVSQSLKQAKPDDTLISPQPNSTCRPDF